MRYQIFTNTPAHVHLYKHVVRALVDRGHDVLVLGRDYGCTKALLEYYDLPHRIYGKCGTTKYSLFRELPKHYLRIARETRRFDPDLIFGYGSYAAHAGAFSRTPTVLVHDSDTEGIDQAISRPFATAILTPRAFTHDLGEKHYRFDGFKECAYLHPDVYEPTTDIREQLGLDADERFAILRLNAFGSHHDVSQSGFSPQRRRELVERLSDHATVLVSDEGGNMDLSSLDARPFDLHPALLHDALAEAHLLIADTQTMVTEAAMLGTPAIRSNSFVGDDDMGNFVELADHGLIYNFSDFDDVVETALDIIADDGATERWRRKRDDFVAGTVNLTSVLLDVASDFEALDSIRGLEPAARRRAVPRPT